MTRTNKLLISAGILSILVHTGLGLSVLLADATEEIETELTLDLIDSESPNEIAVTNIDRQIVDQAVTNQKESKADAFLSASNQIVEKETVATKRGEFKNALGARPKASASAQLFENYQSATFRKIAQSDELGELQKNNEQSPQHSGAGSATTDTGQSIEESQTQDYIKNKDAGLQTLLNTREFKYYSYYNRIRKQLSYHWEDRVKEKLSVMFKQGRAPASVDTDRITKLMIVLNEKGTLVKVQLVKDSGITDLDDAAIEAFRAAAPFPNPPAGIVEEDGTVKIRWDFVLET